MWPNKYGYTFSYSRDKGVKMYKINAMGFKEIQFVNNGSQHEMEKKGWRYEKLSNYKKSK